jgi:hypothetical protein
MCQLDVAREKNTQHTTNQQSNHPTNHHQLSTVDVPECVSSTSTEFSGATIVLSKLNEETITSLISQPVVAVWGDAKERRVASSLSKGYGVQH